MTPSPPPVAALGGRPGIYNVVDDEPAPLSEWLPAYAQALAAPPPRRVSVWLARLMAGRYGAHLMTTQRGAANAKARQALGWAPTCPSWRTGFRAGLGEAEPDPLAIPSRYGGCDREAVTV